MHQCIFKLLYTIYPLTLRTTQVEAADCVLITSVVSNHCSGLIYVIITHSPYAGTVKVQRTKVLKKFFSPGVSVGAEIAGWYKGRALRASGEKGGYGNGAGGAAPAPPSHDCRRWVLTLHNKRAPDVGKCLHKN